MSMSEPVPLRERVALDYDLHLVSLEELQAFCNEDLKRLKPQILAGRRETDLGAQYEIFISYGEKKT
jgi:hypothetical protein